MAKRHKDVIIVLTTEFKPTAEQIAQYAQYMQSISALVSAVWPIAGEHYAKFPEATVVETSQGNMSSSLTLKYIIKPGVNEAGNKVSFNYGALHRLIKELTAVTDRYKGRLSGADCKCYLGNMVEPWVQVVSNKSLLLKKGFKDEAIEFPVGRLYIDWDPEDPDSYLNVITQIRFLGEPAAVIKAARILNRHVKEMYDVGDEIAFYVDDFRAHYPSLDWTKLVMIISYNDGRGGVGHHLVSEGDFPHQRQYLAERGNEMMTGIMRCTNRPFFKELGYYELESREQL